VLTIGPLVGGGQPEAIRGDNHLGDLPVGRGWQVVFLVDDEQAELIAVLVDVAVGAVVGGDGDRGDVVAAAAEDADRFRELVAEGVGERGVPLVHEVNRRRHDEY